ncbi:MAG: NAD(P)-binding domain-containing protein, partial [Gammaproteobacteria bacterium]
MTHTFSLFSETKSRLESKSARIGVVGLGYVGLPLALTVHDAGFRAVGFDINADRVDRINAGERVISYFAETRIADAVASGRFSATAELSRLSEMDVIVICVPTPLSVSREPELGHVVTAAEAIA